MNTERAFFVLRFSIHDPSYAFLECRRAEIDQEAYGKIQKTEVGQQLFAVNGLQRFNGFQLEDQLVLDEKIRAEPFFKNDPLVTYDDGFLPFDFQSPLREQLRQNRLVDRFEQPGPQIPMQRIGRVNDNRGDFFDGRF